MPMQLMHLVKMVSGKIGEQSGSAPGRKGLIERSLSLLCGVKEGQELETRWQGKAERKLKQGRVKAINSTRIFENVSIYAMYI